MVVTHDGSRWVVRCAYAERHVPKAVGCVWDVGVKKWVTTDPAVAELMLGSFDDLARRAWEMGAEKAAVEVAKSSAADTAFEVALPPGEHLYGYQKAGVEYALARKDALIADEPGLGKGHPISTLVATPTGWIALGDLQAGHEVIGQNGKPTFVEAVYDRGVLPVYSVLFEDGPSMRCDAEHLWSVYNEARADWETIDTLEVLRRHRANIPVLVPTLGGPVERPNRLYEIDPFRAGVIAAKPSTYFDSPAIDVPSYALGAPHQRLRFLGGYLSAMGRPFTRSGEVRLSYYDAESREAEIDAVADMVRSVGGIAHVEKLPGSGRLRLVVYVPDEDVARVLPHSTQGPRFRWRRAGRDVPLRAVVDIRLAGRDFVRCIRVSAPDHHYVIQDYAVSHNTVQGIGVANMAKAKRVLVICPASLKENWRREWERFQTLGLSVGIADSKHWPDTDVVIANYDILKKRRADIQAVDWSVLICDEAHYLKNADSLRSTEVFGKISRGVVYPGIRAERRVFLTGTPILSRPVDLWPLVRACDPQGLGANYDKYVYRYCAAWSPAFGQLDVSGASNTAELNSRLRASFMVRRLKSDVMSELPPKTRQIITLPADGLRKAVDAERDALGAALALYEQQLGIARTGEIDCDEMSSLVDKMSAMSYEQYEDQLKTRDLKDVEDTPLMQLAAARRDLALAKIPLVVEHVKRMRESVEKIVIWAWHRDVIRALREAFPGAASISGETPQKKRQGEVDRFQRDPDCHEFVGQILAAGTGHTLTAAYTEVFAELSWTPSDITQAEDRCHRRGQTENVLIQHLTVANSLDDRVIKSLIRKQEVISSILDAVA